HVTGVQTCALPISRAVGRSSARVSAGQCSLTRSAARKTAAVTIWVSPYNSRFSRNYHRRATAVHHRAEEMPIYAYRCASCGAEKDVLQKFSDATLTTCPACDA